MTDEEDGCYAGDRFGIEGRGGGCLKECGRKVTERRVDIDWNFILPSPGLDGWPSDKPCEWL